MSDIPRSEDMSYSMNLNNNININYGVNSPHSRNNNMKIRISLYVHLQRCNQVININDVMGGNSGSSTSRAYNLIIV